MGRHVLRGLIRGSPAMRTIFRRGVASYGLAIAVAIFSLRCNSQTNGSKNVGRYSAEMLAVGSTDPVKDAQFHFEWCAGNGNTSCSTWTKSPTRPAPHGVSNG